MSEPGIPTFRAGDRVVLAVEIESAVNLAGAEAKFARTDEESGRRLVHTHPGTLSYDRELQLTTVQFVTSINNETPLGEYKLTLLVLTTAGGSQVVPDDLPEARFRVEAEPTDRPKVRAWGLDKG